VLDGLDWYFAYRFPGLDTIPKIAMAGIAAGSRTAAVTTPVLDAGGTKPAADRSPAHLAGSRPRDQTTGRGPAGTGQLQIGNNAKSGFAATPGHLTLPYSPEAAASVARPPQ
jgi:hypothetical protein